ncbi:hypothetical protein ZWY2020_028990 [Hordeum vulgare]|nr:hypothetical protein ZWY2020_028990 [Hordeum vulgare]
MVRALWPDAVEPMSMGRLSRWLEAGSSHLDASRASAARAGAYLALHLAKSCLEHDANGNVVPANLFHLQPYDAEGNSVEAAFEEEAAESSSEAYVDSTARGGEGASTSRVAGDGEATTSGAVVGATDGAAAP